MWPVRWHQAGRSSGAAGAGTPFVIVRDADQDAGEIVWQALKIGYEALAGELAEPWDGRQERITMVTADRLEVGAALDVRQDSEYAAGHVPGAAHIELGELPVRAVDVPREPTVVMCGHGERAMTAASLLAQAGHRQVRVLDGGPDDWAKATGQPLEEGT
ncbi:rhodanese-like domain-containing protein [Streptosporangium sp. NPDC087985]|uniref:rhodanese-like domain-containing protein n=1 Tax=Streptosporangium sp. NPDC087985 TaxID=3366196 RepID=UPI0038247F0F